MLNLNFQNGQAPALNARNMNAIVESINTLGYAVGGPNVANTASEMTDTSKVYVYTGSETGYTAGNWYYYNGSAWVSGGVYQAAAVETNTTLTMPGEPADAKATGDAVADLKSALNDLQITVDGVENYEKGKKLITAVGDTRGQLTPDSNFATSEFIDISLFGGNGKTIKVEYGEISENTMFALYNSNHVYLDSWSLATNATNRPFTFSYTSYTDPKYVRFSFENGINAKISIMDGVTEISTVWQTAATGGNTNDIASLQRIVNNFPNTYMMDDVYIDLSMINRLDPAECELNKIVTPSTGSVDTYSGYFTTDFIPIYPGETLRFWRIDTVTVKNVRMFAAFDSDKNVIPSLGSTSEVSSITQSGDMAFVKCSIPYLASDFARTPEDTGALTNANPVYIPGYGNNQSIKSKYLSRDVVWIRKTDTESQIIQKFVDAFANGNTDVYFERASYEFGTELAKVNTDYGMPHNEIPVGNGCRYYFNGSTLTATIDLSQHPAVGDDEFYCNFFGCQRRPSSFEMHDGVLIATDTRYVVHDESSALTGSFKHLYQNMEMHYNTNARQETIRKCIGGGTGESGVVEIVGCKFSTDASDSCVSYHGNGTDVIGAEFDLNVRDCWFSNSIRAGKLSEHQTGRFYYTGNSAASAPTTYVGWTVTSFLNETRT